MESIRQLIKKNQKVALGLVVVFALFTVYNTFFADSIPVENLSSESRAITDLEAGREIISTLNRLKGIEIDPQILEDELFRNLFDFSKPLPLYQSGKENPFRFGGPAGASEDLIQGETIQLESAPTVEASDGGSTDQELN